MQMKIVIDIWIVEGTENVQKLGSGCVNTKWPKIMYTHFDMKNITL